MSQKRTIKLELDAEDVIKKLDGIEKELGEVKEGVKDGTKEMGKLGHSANLTAKGMTTLAGGIGIVAIALKALAITTIYAAFDTFYNILQQNQRVLDATNKAFETMSIFTRSLITDMLNFTTKGIAKDFFDQFEKAVPILRKTVDSITNMSSKLRVLKIGFQLFNNIFGLTDRVDEAQKLADEIVNLRNEVMLAEAEQRLLQLTYQKEAEDQRQIRDDIRKTAQERKKANERLGEILEQQLQDEKVLANERLRLADLVLSTDEKNIQFKVERTNALTELADLEERITGQRSEQKVNEASLDQEIHDSRIENTGKIIALDKIQIQSGEDLLDAKMKQNLKLLNNQKLTSDAMTEIVELESQAKRDIIANSMQQISDSMAEGSKTSKALAIGATLINTYSAATNALAPVAAGGAGPIWGIPIAAAAVVSGLANVAKIRSTQLPGVTDYGGGDGPTPSVPGGGISGIIPNMETISPPTGSLDTPPIQAFVIENDISNAQALQHELETQATL
jgi:hypothetical protein